MDSVSRRVFLWGRPALPGRSRTSEQANKDAITLFESDLLPEQEWHSGAEEAAKITQLVLFVCGSVLPGP